MNVIEMPVINFTGTKLKIDEKITEYNNGKPLIEQIRGYHFDTLWRLIEHFAFKIKDDNKTKHPDTRRINAEHPDRILWTDSLSRENIKEWIRVSSINTVTNRLQRLAEAGFIKLTNRSKNNKHYTSIIELNKDVIAIDDALSGQAVNHTQMSVKTRSKQLKNDLQTMKNRFAENQQVSLPKNQSLVPLLNKTKNNNLTNKLIQSGAFSEKSEKGVKSIPNSSNSANPFRDSPKQGNSSDMIATNRKNYADLIRGTSKKVTLYTASDEADKLEDYRRSAAGYVFRRSLVLWKHRKDVYEGEYKKATRHVLENYFVDCETIKQINDEVSKVLWCIEFQKSQRKNAKGEHQKEQFVFYPYEYLSGTGVGTLEGIFRYYNRYKLSIGNTLTNTERVRRKIPIAKKKKTISSGNCGH